VQQQKQVAIKALDNFHISSKLIWDCLQSVVKLADLNRMQLVWMPRHMGINGNEKADQVAWQGFSHSLIQPKLACGTSVQRFPRKESGTGQVRNIRRTGSTLVDKGNLRNFLKDPLQNQLGN